MQIDLSTLLDKLPAPFKNWLVWYLAPWRKLARKPFNIILLFISLPILGFQLWLLWQAMNNFDVSDINSTAGLLQALDFGPWLDVLALAQGGLFVALIPLFAMRLRDLDWSQRWLWLLYAPFIADFITRLGLSVPMLLILPITLSGLVLGLRLCSKKGQSTANENLN